MANNDMNETVSKGADKFSDMTHKIGGKMKDAGDNLVDKATDSLSSVGQAARECGSNAASYLKDHPTQSCIMAAVLGFVLGAIIAK